LISAGEVALLANGEEVASDVFWATDVKRRAARPRSHITAEDAMRFDLRLHGRTASGQPCRADVRVHARSQRELQEQATRAAETAAWVASDPPHDPIPDATAITVERVERL
jgi:hypothetical protein